MDGLTPEGVSYSFETEAKVADSAGRDRSFAFLALAEGFVEEDGGSGGGV